MGEGMLYDARLMPFISSANIACGYHAGDEDTMKHTIELCLEHKVAIGAHPGFADKQNFGRKEQLLSDEDYYQLIIDQLIVLSKIAEQFHVKIHHIKPHGALYNVAAKNKTVAAAIAKAVQSFDQSLVLYGLSGSFSITEAERYGLKTACEVFADRTYQDDGSLTSRAFINAMIESEEMALSQVMQMIATQTITSVNGIIVPVKAETICIHGDGAHAVPFATLVHQTLKQHNIAIQQIS